MDELELIRQLPGENPPPRPEARAAARAALIARFEGERRVPGRAARRRSGWIPRLALAGALGGVVAALLIALGASEPGGRPAFAEGAELRHLARLAPHFQIAGGWQVIDVSAGPDGGATRFHYERTSTSVTDDAEIRWSGAPIAQLGRHLEQQGLRAAGVMPTSTLDVPKWRGGDLRHMNIHGHARAYVSVRDGRGFRRVVGIGPKVPGPSS